MEDFTSRKVVAINPYALSTDPIKNFNEDLLTLEELEFKDRVRGIMESDLRDPEGRLTVNFDGSQYTVELGEIEFVSSDNREAVKFKETTATLDPQEKKVSEGGGIESNLTSIVQNPLEQFASYNSLWTLAVLTPQQFNNPELYRTDDLSFAGQSYDIKSKPFGDFDEPITRTVKSSIIFSSGGRGDEYRQNTFDTPLGAPEYYINNFNMKCVISANESTGNSNAMGFKFEIYEPYSMGLLLQTMQAAAINAGYSSYLDDAPYVLRLDITGFNQDGAVLRTMKPKFFVMKLSKCSFKVDEGGSKYEVEAIAYNHVGFSDTINNAFTKIKIKAAEQGTVEEMLTTGPESLVAVLNKNEQDLVNSGAYTIPDQYDIQFPQDSQSFVRTKNPETDKKAVVYPGQAGQKSIVSQKKQTVSSFDANDIGKARFKYGAKTGGNFDFSKEGDVYNEETGLVERDKMTIDPNTRVFQFKEKQPLTDIIVQVVLSSNYAKAALDPANLTPEGYIKWFRLDVQIEFLDFDVSIGDFAKKYTYRVVPFFVHHTIFSNAGTVPIGYDVLASQITKKYEYIYTGQNNDILNFDIKIENLFYKGVDSSPPQITGDVQNSNNQGTAVANTTKAKNSQQDPKIDNAEAQAAFLGKAKVKRSAGLINDRKGGDAFKDVERKVAETFHKAFIDGSSADMVTVDLEVLGDTYWLIDSGVSNYFAKKSSQASTITEDGTAHYEGQDVYIYIKFATPTDVDVYGGLYEFSKSWTDSPFSGIYRVSEVENLFNNGIFKQTLKCVRQPGQATDFKGKQLDTTKTEALALTLDETEDLVNDDEEFNGVI